MAFDTFVIVVPKDDIYHPETGDILLKADNGYFYSAFKSILIDNGIDNIEVTIRVIEDK